MAGTTPEGLVPVLAGARHIVVLTGSGVSAESGVPTFRDAQTGLWERYRPEDLATPGAFERDPQLVWNWYEWRRGLVRGASPNEAHRALARLAGRHPPLTLITQNVDGLHQRAGSPSVIEFHGNLFVDRCSRAGCHSQPCAEEPRTAPPNCPRCGRRMRPGVVWFGESIPESALAAALQALESCDVFLSLGTSSQVHPAASFADLAARRGACIVELNPQDTPLSAHADFCIRDQAARSLPALVAAAFP
jgi:NAD-dependent deacetylase